ncbi:NAD-specific glutamate dehydrogenase [Candidatus Vampirococcus lugosii]|uniref:NAD-specific glutamate dehydrogenase n=1 Tax=Candidatus Vampirococcus lugosii TaxID=2789015 RepID=A0ABS5QMW3_9BACT|nr:Glu/Leu/Phe/Val dehydrogenase [Candidatus Vampirococcus lugosii]MBS8121819.1 NAD-specific glutamate dehydrogenase [Candidatus Vampirococcus lugosii]
MSSFENAQNQIKKSFEYLENKFTKNDLEYILYPDRVIQVNINVEMDNGEVKNFVGYRSQHNNVRGPYKGGIRFHQGVAMDETKALSVWMSMKTALVGIPLGGAKGGIIVDPKSLSDNELEKLSRGYVRKLSRYLGPDYDVPAPDVGTTPQIMAWMMDEYSKLSNNNNPGSFTGKPIQVGGSIGRDTATSRGGFFVLNKILELKNYDLKGKKIAIQGAGNAGINIVKYLTDSGAKLTAISDSKGGIYSEEGLNLDLIKSIKDNKKSVVEYENVNILTNEELLELDVDILILAALENQITESNADNIKSNIVLELANGPINMQADNILSKKMNYSNSRYTCKCWLSFG